MPANSVAGRFDTVVTLFSSSVCPVRSSGRPRPAFSPPDPHQEVLGRRLVLQEPRRRVNRLVAVKNIKAGMDTKTILAPFEAEGQALSMMDHPHIVQVLGVGTTAAGHSCFAAFLASLRKLPL
jgi:hypothetical protein